MLQNRLLLHKRWEPKCSRNAHETLETFSENSFHIYISVEIMLKMLQLNPLKLIFQRAIFQTLLEIL